MSLNFSAFEGKNIFKFAKYEIKEINKTKYIVSDSIITIPQYNWGIFISAYKALLLADA